MAAIESKISVPHDMQTPTAGLRAVDASAFSTAIKISFLLCIGSATSGQLKGLMGP